MIAKYLIPVTILILVLGLYYRLNPLTSKVRIGKTIFTVDVAVTEAQKEQGLGGRDSLAKGTGMLFPYDHKEQYEYWMRNMKFPLDFIWIDGNVVADLTPNVPPPRDGERPIIVKPLVPVDKVLEIAAGEAEKFGIRVGDAVQFLDR